MDFLKCIQNKIESKEIQIGWVGTGVMGHAMCGHLIEAGFSVSVFTRTKSKADSLLQKGARWCETPKQLAQNAELIFTMVGFPRDVEEIYFSKNGILQNAKSGSAVVDCTTSQPSLAQKIYDEALAKNIFALDAPVSGGDVGAKSATLSIMVGGDPRVFEILKPILKIFGKNIVHQGLAGSGQHTKMCNQIVIASTMIGMCEALIYGQKAGLEMTTVLQSIAKGAAGCWSLDNYAPRILRNDFEPGFFVEHFLKDLNIALQECEKMQINLPGLELAKRLYQKTQELGFGKKGTQALYLALKGLN